MPKDKAPQMLDSEDEWLFIETWLNTIMANPVDGEIDKHRYMRLYTSVYNLCQDPNGLVIHPYQRLKTYLTEHLDSVSANANNHTGEKLLAFYVKEWKRYATAAKYINNVFRYLNGSYMKRELDEGKKNVDDIYTLHFVLWRRFMLPDTHERVMAGVLRLVEMHRNGKTVELSLVKDVVNSFEYREEPSLKVYKLYFERPILEATKEYYEKESKQLLVSESVNQVAKYAKKVEARLDQEKERATLYLHDSTVLPLMEVCLDILVRRHSDTLRRILPELQSSRRQEDFDRVDKLLAQEPGDYVEASDEEDQ